MIRKEFFKITRNKVLITIFVILLFIINILTGVFGGPHFNLIIIFPLVLFTIPAIYIKGIIAFFSLIIGLIVEIIYLYSISCFTNSVYGKCFKKSQKK